MKSEKKSGRITVVTKILEANDRVAEENRRMFSEAGAYAIDLIGSPGAGKTMLLEATLPALAGLMRVGVIAGDIETTLDAQRISAFNVPVVQATTGAFGGACHLEASTVRQAADQLDLDCLDLVFIENVGNLVCPAEFDIGQGARVVVLSVTEGEDKPLKYPLAFSTADFVVINKADLLPYLDLDMDALRRNLRQVNPKLEWVELSARTGGGLDSWIGWIRDKMDAREGPAKR
jgi:hydrogenase nickel incorporation protein HypB